MATYSAKLYAKNIPKVDLDSTVGQELLRSDSTMTFVVPQMTTGKAKNLRSVSLKTLMKYMGSRSSKIFTQIYGYNERGEFIGELDPNNKKITLSESRNNFESLLFVYGDSNSVGSVTKYNTELNILINISNTEIRLVELSSGAISISSLTEDLSANKTSFVAGDWINSIIAVYGVGSTQEY